MSTYEGATVIIWGGTPQPSGAQAGSVNPAQEIKRAYGGRISSITPLVWDENTKQVVFVGGTINAHPARNSVLIYGTFGEYEKLVSAGVL